MRTNSYLNCFFKLIALLDQFFALGVSLFAEKTKFLFFFSHLGSQCVTFVLTFDFAVVFIRTITTIYSIETILSQIWHVSFEKKTTKGKQTANSVVNTARWNRLNYIAKIFACKRTIQTSRSSRFITAISTFRFKLNVQFF